MAQPPGAMAPQGDAGRFDRPEASARFAAGLEDMREGRLDAASERFRALVLRWPELPRPRAALARAAARAGRCDEARSALAGVAEAQSEWFPVRAARVETDRLCAGWNPPRTRLSVELGLPERGERTRWPSAAPVSVALAERGWGGAWVALQSAEARWTSLGVEMSEDGYAGAPGAARWRAARRLGMWLRQQEDGDARLVWGAGAGLAPAQRPVAATEDPWRLDLDVGVEAENDAALARSAVTVEAGAWRGLRLRAGATGQAWAEAGGALAAVGELRLGAAAPLTPKFSLRAEGVHAAEFRRDDAGRRRQSRSWAAAALRRELDDGLAGEIFAEAQGELSPGAGLRARLHRVGALVAIDRVNGALGRLELGVYRGVGAARATGGWVGLDQGW